MTVTEDPVDLVELALRTGIDRDRLSHWYRRGLMMPPHWILGGPGQPKGIWAWEKVQHDPKIAEVLGNKDWSWVLEAMPPGCRYWLHTYPTRDAFLTGHKWLDEIGKGWVSVPTPEGGYLIATEKRKFESWGSRVSFEDARQAVSEQLDQMGDVRRAAIAARPNVGQAWRD